MSKRVNEQQIPIDVKKLSEPRLRNYRKLLKNDYYGYQGCEACGYCCETRWDEIKEDPRFRFLESELERVNTELSIRCRAQVAEKDKKNEAHVYTISEWKRHHHPPRREWVKEMKKSHERRK